MHVLMRRLAIAVALGGILGLAACGDSEPDQRKAFMAFLQTRILDKPGIHVPALTDEERTSFGPCADHYKVITAFHETLDKTISPQMRTTMQKGAITSLGDLVQRRDVLKAAHEGMQQIRGAMGADKAQADTAHAKLSQPDDLKAVYDKAYDRLITNVATVMDNVLPAADKVLGEGEDLADYLSAHKNTVKVEGLMIQVSDPKIQSEVNTKIQAIQNDQRGMMEAQSKLQALMYGR